MRGACAKGAYRAATLTTFPIGSGKLTCSGAVTHIMPARNAIQVALAYTVYLRQLGGSDHAPPVGFIGAARGEEVVEGGSSQEPKTRGSAHLCNGGGTSRAECHPSAWPRCYGPFWLFVFKLRDRGLQRVHGSNPLANSK